MDHIPLLIIGAIIVIAVIRSLSSDKGKSDDESFESQKSYGNDHSESSPNYESITSKQIAFDSLKAIGCQPKFMDETTLFVEFQGEKFEFAFPEEQNCRYARIWDPCWAGIEANNPDINLIKEAVNTANFSFGPTVVMSEPDENNYITFHSRYDIMLHPNCPDNDQYIRAVLVSLFGAKELVRDKFQELNAKQTEQHKNRRPIGFETPANQNNNTTSATTQSASPQ